MQANGGEAIDLNFHRKIKTGIAGLLSPCRFAQVEQVSTNFFFPEIQFYHELVFWRRKRRGQAHAERDHEVSEP